uniref:HORMA domain-containing protein n=1 Tax=Timema genevievae TaxID=629358 RepID=A0A7R9JVQ1_TIMGE|nr:unnamed protein product [Timema genevievae]
MTCSPHPIREVGAFTSPAGSAYRGPDTGRLPAKVQSSDSMITNEKVLPLPGFHCSVYPGLFHNPEHPGPAATAGFRITQILGLVTVHQYSAPLLQIRSSRGHIPRATHNASVATVQYAPESLRSTLLCSLHSILEGSPGTRQQSNLRHRGRIAPILSGMMLAGGWERSGGGKADPSSGRNPLTLLCSAGEVKEGFGNQINLCRNRGLNPGPSAQKSDTLPLDHQNRVKPKASLVAYDRELSSNSVHGINSVLYQRGIYPPESFIPVEQFDLTLLTSFDERVKFYLNKVLGQIEEFMLKKLVKQVSMVIIRMDTLDPIERWDFSIEYENNELNETCPKDKSLIQKEICNVLRQISASISYLPLLDTPYR